MTVPAVIKGARERVQARRLPESLERALADPHDFTGKGPETWRAPVVMPSADDCQVAVSSIEYRLIPGSFEDVQTCVMAMATVLAIKGDDESTWETRTQLYALALNDIPADLLETATIRIIKSAKFFPEPATFRKEIESELDLRKRMLRRAKWLHDEARNPTKRVEPFKREADHVRVAGLIVSYGKINRVDKVEQYTRELLALAKIERETATREGRTIAEWVADVLAAEPPPPIDTPTSKGLEW